MCDIRVTKILYQHQVTRRVHVLVLKGEITMKPQESSFQVSCLRRDDDVVVARVNVQASLGAIEVTLEFATVTTFNVHGGITEYSVLYLLWDLESLQRISPRVCKNSTVLSEIRGVQWLGGPNSLT